MILAVGQRDLTVALVYILIVKSFMTWSPREYGRLSNKCAMVM